MSFRKRFRKFSAALALVFLLGSCLEATPPTPVFGDVQVGWAVTPSSTTALLDEAVSLEEVRLNIRRVDLKPETGTDLGVDHEGPFVVNSIAGGEVVNETFPPLQLVSIPAERYRWIKYRIDNLRADEIPDGLAGDDTVQSFLVGNSVVIEGSFLEREGNDIDGSGGVSRVGFRFLSSMIVNLRLNPAEAFSIEEGETVFVFLVMDLPFWFEPVLAKLQELDADELTDGLLAIERDSDSTPVREIAGLLEDAIKLGAKFAQSTDDDRFEEDEIDPASSSEILFDDEE